MANLRFDGRLVPCEPGDTIASSLHRQGILEISRSMKYHRARGLYCVTGSCASCFVNVAGVPNVPACTTPAQDGQQVVSQNRIGSAKRDILGVTDKVYRRGFDPHGAFTRPRLLNLAFIKAVRFMSGVGKVPDPEARAAPSSLHEIAVDELVIGAGRRGLQRALDAHGRTLVVDELDRLGGSLRWDPTERDTADLVQQVQASDAETWTGALAFGIYGDVVAVARGGDLWQVRAKRITIAPGCHDAWPIFANNDLPGILSLRGAKRLLHAHGVAPGRRIAVHGTPLDAPTVASLDEAGCDVVAQGTVEAARGGTRVEAARMDGTWHACDTVVCALSGTPRVELFQQAGCRLGFVDGVLAPITQNDGATSRADVWWAGGR